jgi:P27 family predicted phage terminase small subunit
MPAGRPKKPLERKARLSVGDGKNTSHGGKKQPGTEIVEIVDAEIVDETEVSRVADRAEIPPVPYGVYGRGETEWHQIWESGWWLHPKEDYHWVEQIVRSYCDLEEFRTRVARDGLVVTGYNGQAAAHPLIKEMRSCEGAIRTCLSQLGFSPTDRARLSLQEVKKQNSLAELKKRTQENRS